MSVSAFETNLFNVNGSSGMAYVFGREGADFHDHDRSEVENELRGMGHNVVASALESHVIDVDAGIVVTEGVIKVFPALRKEERKQFGQRGILVTNPTLH